MLNQHPAFKFWFWSHMCTILCPHDLLGWISFVRLTLFQANIWSINYLVWIWCLAVCHYELTSEFYKCSVFWKFASAKTWLLEKLTLDYQPMLKFWLQIHVFIWLVNTIGCIFFIDGIKCRPWEPIYDRRKYSTRFADWPEKSPVSLLHCMDSPSCYFMADSFYWSHWHMQRGWCDFGLCWSKFCVCG